MCISNNLIHHLIKFRKRKQKYNLGYNKMKNTLEIYENFSYIKLVKLNKNSFSNETKIKNKIIKKIILSSK